MSAMMNDYPYPFRLRHMLLTREERDTLATAWARRQSGQPTYDELRRRCNAAEIMLCDIGDVLGDVPDDEEFREVMGWADDPFRRPMTLIEKVRQVRGKVMRESSGR